MTRRLTIAIVGVVAGALLLAGVGTLVLARLAARRETRDELVRQAEALAPIVVATDRLEQLPPRAAPVQGRRMLDALRASFRFQGIEHTDVAAIAAGERPAGVELAGSLDTLRAGGTAAGWDGDLVWAAAPVELPRGTQVVVLTRDAGGGLRTGGRWFVAAAAVALAAAMAVALSLGRRLTEPVRAVQRATAQLAGGDLSARVEVPRGGDELTALAQSVNTMAGELERARGLERQFLLSISHDLRTPLTSIRGYAEAIADGTAPDAARAAAVIHAEADRLERLVRDLLDLARLDAHRFSLDVGPVDLAELVDDVADGFRPAADDAGVRLVVDAVPGTRALADPDRVAQIVANLVENALRFASSTVTVGAGDDGGRPAVWVDDDGPGIPERERPKVFERLYTSARRQARAGTGTGLGLAIVKELAEAMGGDASVAPTVNGGARLVVHLPPPDSLQS